MRVAQLVVSVLLICGVMGYGWHLSGSDYLKFASVLIAGFSLFAAFLFFRMEGE